MPKTGIKALLTILALNRSSRPLDWDRVIIAGSTIVTSGLVALYAYAKVAAQW
jgi:hypothetical protein